jgi:hypothetical protein
MSEQHHGNVLGGAIGETAQTAAQLATTAATAAQTVARVRAWRLAADHARDQATADAERAVLRSEHAAGRLTWAPGLEPSFRRTASGPEAAAVWGAAQPWIEHDPSAREAARRAEQRLGVLYPHLSVQYEQRLADGLDPVDAMAYATADLGPIDVNGAAAARALAGDERGEAQQDSASPDVIATVSVDEHSQGLHAGATHAAVSETASARAALLAAQAYPRPLRGALGRAPSTGPTQPRAVRDLRHSRGR